ncbi:MAG: hypothetical protein EOM67_03625 [Spirochaetia bacterium]|nr:hypothetical protein [Spirochaetia bacterium]
MAIRRTEEVAPLEDVVEGTEAPVVEVKVEKVPTFLGVKKTMESLAKELVEQGVNTMPGWDKILKLMLPATTESSSEPKALTILKDEAGEVIARMCTITNRWYLAERFYKNGSIIKEADGAKNKLYAESKTMENNAKSILEEARTLTNVEDKLAKFEEYDHALEAAKAHRNQPILVDEKWLEGSFDSLDEVKASLA